MKHGVIAAIGQSLTSNNPMVCSKSAELLACFIDGAQAREQVCIIFCFFLVKVLNNEKNF